MIVGFGDVTKNMGEGIWYDSFEFRHGSITFHCESLTGTGLTVGKDGTIVTFQDVINNIASDTIVDINLKCNQMFSCNL